jgi:hypothetical protein
MLEVSMHTGNIIVIDGMLSDEISYDMDRALDNAIYEAHGNSDIGMRMWGCDAGEGPYTDWKGFGVGQLVHDSQEEAIASVAEALRGSQITVTGAWATDDLSSGCVSSVINALRKHLGDEASISLSDFALREPYEDPKPDL